jgi:hypothetical protein
MNSRNLLLTVIGTLALAGPAGDASARGLAYWRAQAPAPLEGSWIVSIQPVVCTTGADVPNVPPVTSYLTFAAGSTMTESTSNPAFAPGQRGSGHGYWERTGRTSYQFVMQAFVTAESGRYKPGHQRIEQTVEMHSKDDWTSTGPVQFFDVFDLASAPGRTPYIQGCARATGLRMF